METTSKGFKMSEEAVMAMIGKPKGKGLGGKRPNLPMNQIQSQPQPHDLLEDAPPDFGELKIREMERELEDKYPDLTVPPVKRSIETNSRHDLSGMVRPAGPVKAAQPVRAIGSHEYDTKVEEAVIRRKTRRRGIHALNTVPVPSPSTSVPKPSVLVKIPKREAELEPGQDPEQIETIPKIDLRSMVMSFVEHLGMDKSAAFFEKDASTISRWINGKAQPGLDAAQKILDRRPDAARRFSEVWAAAEIENGKTIVATKEKLSVLMGRCVKGDINPYVDLSHVYYLKKYDIGMAQQIDTLVIRSRNLLAQTFLKSGFEWLWMVDADVVLPIENAAWFNGLTSTEVPGASMNAIERLLSHKQPIVGGVYASRRLGGSMIIAPDLSPHTEADRAQAEKIRKGSAKGLLEVEWLATGCVLVHRSVFEGIMAKFKHLEPKNDIDPFPFFSPDANNTGEDISFSERVRAAGFTLYLDQELVLGHIGRFAFLPQHTVALPRI